MSEIAPVTSATVIAPTIGRHRAKLAALLASLERQTVSHQVIIVDNGSPNRGASEVCRRFPAAEVIRLERNEGFSRAVNVAARRAEGTALVLVNDDCVCDPEFVERITARLDRTDGTVMAAGVLRDPSNLARIDTAGIEIDRTLLAFSYLGGEPLSRLNDELAPPVGPAGAAAAFDREAFLSVDGFDEALFAYWEDVDLALRLRSEGGRCALARDALGTHAHSSTLDAGSAHRNHLMGFGRGYVLRKWGVVTPRRLLPVIGREALICLGQLGVDRTLSGITGRIEGFVATRQTESYPADLAQRGLSDGTWGALRRRADFSAALRSRPRVNETRRSSR